MDLKSGDSRRPDGVLFDLDGTLLDSEKLYEQAMASALAELGYSHSWEVEKTIVGQPELLGAQMILDAFSITGLTPHQLIEKRDSHLVSLFKSAKPRVGVLDLVSRIKRSGLKIAVGTNTFSHYFKIKSEANKKLFSMIDAVVCGDDPEIVEGKPAPDIYWKAARLIGVDPKRCVVFEDSVSGYRAARASGAMKVFVSPDSRMSLDPFEGADGIFPEWSDFDPEMIGV